MEPLLSSIFMVIHFDFGVSMWGILILLSFLNIFGVGLPPIIGWRLLLLKLVFFRWEMEDASLVNDGLLLCGLHNYLSTSGISNYVHVIVMYNNLKTISRLIRTSCLD